MAFNLRKTVSQLRRYGKVRPSFVAERLQNLMLELRNPHSVLATLSIRPKAVRSVRVSSNSTGTAWDDVAETARERGISVTIGRPEQQQSKRRETERMGAGMARVEPPSPVPPGNLWKNLPAEGNGLWLALDHVQDPQNLGAIFRLAGFFNVRGILMTKDRSAPVNATVCDVAVGGVEHVPFSVVPNLTQAFKKAQKSDIWVVGTCERSKESVRDVPRDRHWMLVMGNEGDGMRRLTRESCDSLVALSAVGPVPSLNVAAATAACLTVLSAQ